METENFAAFDLQREHRRTLRATRVAATMCILLAAGWCWLKYEGVDYALNMVTYSIKGGFDGLPAMVGIILGGGHRFISIAQFGGLVCLAWVWFSGYSISRVIYAGIVGVASYLILGLAFDYAVARTVTLINWKFGG
jgi:hypothetical protein